MVFCQVRGNWGRFFALDFAVRGHYHFHIICGKEASVKRNLTLSIDEDLLNKARIICQKRHTTLTKHVRTLLEELVQHDEQYESAMKRIIALMNERPIRVGDKTWSREELHER
jgi:hypothetical protein